MNLNKLKLGLDFLMFADFIIVLYSGFMIKSSRGMLHLHNNSSIILFVLIGIHLILNWRWIYCMIANLFKSTKY